MTTSARLFLPLLAPGQAQKEITHNEALAQLDIIMQAVVQAVGVDVPPASPALGECWIIGPSPEGSWSGKAQHLAGWTENGWRYVQPFIGLGVWTVDEGMFARWDGGAWVTGIVSAAAVRIGGEQVIGSRQPAIAKPGRWWNYRHRGTNGDRINFGCNAHPRVDRRGSVVKTAGQNI